MRVSNYQSNATKQTDESQPLDKAAKARKLEEAKKHARTSELNKGENVDAESNISGKAKEFAQASEIATNSPDVREAKIAELKRRIANNEYNVKPEDVADRLVDEHAKSSLY